MREVRRLTFLVIGWVCVVVGAITAPMPIPTGLPLLAIGISLLATQSRLMRGLITRLRRRFPGLSARLEAMRAHLPRPLRAVLRRTDPGRPKFLAAIRQAARQRRAEADPDGAALGAPAEDRQL